MDNLRCIRFFPVLVISVWVGAACAQRTGSAPTTPFFATVTPDCAFSATADMPRYSLNIKVGARHPGRKCALSAEETVSIFSEMFGRLPASGKRSRYGNVMIGQIRHYGWMQKFLSDTARNDVEWSRETGKPVARTTMSYVNGVLSSRRILDVFDGAGRRHGYSFTSASCEEILVSEIGLPADAVCWIDLKREDGR